MLMENNVETSLHNEVKVRRRKPGIIYLSSIPPRMNALKLRLYFSKYGQVDKIYLTPIEEKSLKHRHGRMGKQPQYAEGWIEFKSKRKAKLVHTILNNQSVGGKKSDPDYDMLWNIKYLPRFKWAYLKQRLEYENQIRHQRMKTEISQVTKETDYYIKSSEVSKIMKKKLKKKGNTESVGKPTFAIPQKLTEEEILKKKEAKRLRDESFRKKLIEKKKLKKKNNKANKKTIQDDLLESVFVGNSV